MFDYPITLTTEVPAEWKTSTVTQGGNSTTYPVTAGVVQYSAIPNAGNITIVPGGTPLPPPTPARMLPPLPPSPPASPVLPTRVVEDFEYASDVELNSAWWVLPCGNDTMISLDPIAKTESEHTMKYIHAAGDKGISGRLRRNTSLDLSSYGYISMWVKPSNTRDTITFQFMEAIQSEFWETSFTPNSTLGKTVVIPLTKEYFRRPNWFTGARADGVIDLSNIKLVSLYVSGNGGGTVVFDKIKASKTAPASAYIPSPATASTPALTETGRCAIREWRNGNELCNRRSSGHPRVQFHRSGKNVFRLFQGFVYGRFVALFQVCSLRCWLSIRSRSRSLIASQWVSIGCSGTSNPCGSRWKLCSEANSRM